ncbi:hypothetical protein RHMOL_Rhmol09G0091600 [Rhododendron molle]|uniref:Uncharacterized protein n=1 Tax=Rhododendron molle TaxID=49168 RepID=A0ACC0MBG1_RHOML|nr:hypothetical protein RHMOL_Rhmol09G0091600 [Rhododendron molle]
MDEYQVSTSASMRSIKGRLACIKALYSRPVGGTCHPLIGQRFGVAIMGLAHPVIVISFDSEGSGDDSADSLIREWLD